jgi:uncharacterized membrane protein YecN with MAPEG domain
LQIALGDAGNKQMLRAVSVHANFAEYAPFTLFILFLVESQGTPAWLMHLWCIAFSIGRISHAYGVSQANENFKFRISGMMLTFTTILSASVYLLYSTLLQ